MKNLKFLFLLITINLFNAQNAFKDENFGFSMDQPKDWLTAKTGETLKNIKEQIKLDPESLRKLLKENKGSYQIVSFYKYPIDSREGVIPTIKVNFSTNSTNSLETFKNSLENTYKKLKEVFPDFKFLIAPTIKQINGNKCVFGSMTYTVKGNVGEEKVKVMMYAIPVKNHFYQITFMDSEKENNAKLFEDLAKTIVVNK